MGIFALGATVTGIVALGAFEFGIDILGAAGVVIGTLVFGTKTPSGKLLSGLKLGVFLAAAAIPCA